MSATAANVKGSAARGDARRCTRCVIPEGYPGALFDEKGMCSFCRDERNACTTEEREHYRRKFTDLIGRLKGSADYDVLVAYSGGKDSTYTLDLLVNRYNLRALALTLDNTFISSRATENTNRVLDTLGVDHLVMRPEQKTLRTLFRRAAGEDIFPPAALLRASSVCLACIALVKGATLRVAIEKGIPMVAWGWSPGQAPLKASVMLNNPGMVRFSEASGARPVRRVCAGALDPFLLGEEHYAQPRRFPWNVHPLAFHHYDKDALVERITELGWRPPGDVDVNSTNCTLNAFANQTHRERFGYHPYVWEVAGLVRNGVMSRDEGIRDVQSPEDERLVSLARTALLF